ncbi:hypothetical protein DSM03_10776 [Leeuwenhoekiella aestuarii]|uniref:Uncharacterized protein n=1 Tax=Leeuwenhoekiella aestuarii TaxID=2249426 RepID=A0A4V1KNT6_9FLAO|nr:hypothetical protein [Leeuwenhoekiella aestuarii]RXG11979.1 hypothetical protein DSM04_10876 [Leeuwenhoekiella aestuarii]RXG13537.1 hypothetical protein DSM03_10776 [Leeuwenhoekiella aestuarii]
MNRKLLNRTWLVLVTFTLVLSNGCMDQKDQSAKPPKGVISIEEAKILDRTFTETRVDAINKTIGMPDSRSSWWSIEDLEQYIAYAKSQAAEKGSKVNGLRVYYGAYPKDHSNEEVAGYSTLFIVPTGMKTVEKAGLINYNSFLQSNEDLEIAPLNMGHLRKPPPEDYQ